MAAWMWRRPARLLWAEGIGLSRRFSRLTGCLYRPELSEQLAVETHELDPPFELPKVGQSSLKQNVFRTRMYPRVPPASATPASKEPQIEISEPLASTTSNEASLSNREIREWKKVATLFFESRTTRKYAEEQQITGDFYQTVTRSFYVHYTENPARVRMLLKMEKEARDLAMLDMLLLYAQQQFPDQIALFQDLKRTSDMRLPHDWFPEARAMKRKIIYHMGPTNSGKTHAAIQSLMSSQSGVYCAPLRLLALEIYDKLNTLGIPCELVTGQERKEIPGSNHRSCTVEVAASFIHESYDVAVIDEIQMISDKDRGYAWTYAFLGLQAKEIHLCGDPSVEKLIKRLCQITGDEFEPRVYERKTSLTLSKQPMLSLTHVQPGDCIIAFSRKDLFSIKAQIESSSKLRCALVYGKLPPEVRSEQARLFNDENSGFDILVASDAVGMGLNLNIRRIVFTSLMKFDGTAMVPLEHSHIKQIAGRAGRAGSRYPIGEVTCLHPADLITVKEALNSPQLPKHEAGLLPSLEQINYFVEKQPKLMLSQIMDHIASLAQVDGNYFLCSHEDFKILANLLHKIKELTPSDRYVFCIAPVQTQSNLVLKHFTQFASMYARYGRANFQLLSVNIPRITNDRDLALVEAYNHIAEIYIWLGNRLEGFSQLIEVENYRNQLVAQLDKALRSNWNIRRPGH